MSLQLIPLSDELIAKHNYRLNDLWMLKSGKEILGPFHSTQINEEIAKKNPVLDNCDAYNLETETWKQVYEWAVFQRRLPQLVPVTDLMTDTAFYILINGQKEGPLSIEQVENDLKSGKLHNNDLISDSEGKNWIKICEHPHFDRRVLVQKQLPNKPAANLLEESEQKVFNLISKKQSEKEQEDALVGLAFIVHGNDKGQTLTNPQSAPITLPNTTPPGPREKFKFNWSFNRDKITSLKNNKTLIYSTSAITIILTFFTIMNSLNSRFDNGHDIQFVKNRVKKDIKIQKSVLPDRDPNNLPKKRPIAKRLRAKPKQRLYKKAEPKRDIASTADIELDNHRYPDEQDPVVENYPENDPYGVNHDDIELDINDPSVRREISRELASDMIDEHMTDQQRKQIENEIHNEIDNESQRYLEEKVEHYEEVSDFE